MLLRRGLGAAARRVHLPRMSRIAIALPAGLIAFFAVYARCKALLALVRGRKGATRSLGFFPEGVWQRVEGEQS